MSARLLLVAAAATAAASATLLRTSAELGVDSNRAGTSGVSHVRVAEVIDGDTIRVRNPTGGDHRRVRLLGIDAPELSRGPNPAECYSYAATDELASMLPAGRRVRLTPDPGQGNTDVYGRLLRYVDHDGDDVSTSLLKAGAVRRYRTDPPLRIRSELDEAASQAEATNRGLWGRCP